MRRGPLLCRTNSVLSGLVTDIVDLKPRSAISFPLPSATNLPPILPVTLLPVTEAKSGVSGILCVGPG